VQVLSDDDATALAMLLGTVSMQHDNYLPWWRAGNTDSDDDLDDDSDDDDENLDYYRLGRHYHGPGMAGLDSAIAAIIAKGGQILQKLKFTDGTCAWECAKEAGVTPRHFRQAGQNAWLKGVFLSLHVFT